MKTGEEKIHSEISSSVKQTNKQAPRKKNYRVKYRAQIFDGACWEFLEFNDCLQKDAKKYDIFIL